jgi:hypothetical protein
MTDHVFLGASFLHRDPAEPWRAVRGGYVRNVLFGTDYPHAEGTLVETGDERSTTRTALAYIFSGVPEAPLRRMAGQNAIDVYGLPGEALTQVAERIGAPSPEDLAESPNPDTVPAYWSGDD